MKGIHTLIKLHKRKLDELRRKQGELENQKNRLCEASIKLQRELEHEMVIASQQPEMANFFGGFAKRIQKRQEAIAAEIRSLDKQIAEMTDHIAEAFSELKKFEIARDNHKKREEEEQNRKDTNLLDEIAGQQHQRKKEPT